MQRLVQADQNKQIQLGEKDIEELVKMTKGFSGADLKNLSVEAAMIPLRSLVDIASVDVNNIRQT